MNLELHIEELILEGLPLTSSQSAMVQAALETELSRLLIEGGVASELQNGIALNALVGSSLHFADNASPMQMGTQIAHSVYHSLHPSGRETNVGKRTP